MAGMALVAGRERRAALRAVPGAGEQLGPDAWLVARYDPTGWDRPDDPTRDDLDRAVPDRPVLLAHVSGHAVAANSLALALAGIDRAAVGRPGAAGDRADPAGEPTGVVRGPDAWDRIAASMPPPRRRMACAALARAAARLAADGVTSVADADVGSTAGVAVELAAWGEALASGAMPLAVSLLPGLVRIAAEPDRTPSLRPADLAALLRAECERTGAPHPRQAEGRRRPHDAHGVAARALRGCAARGRPGPRSGGARRARCVARRRPAGPARPTRSATPRSTPSLTPTRPRPHRPASPTGSSTRCSSTTDLVARLAGSGACGRRAARVPRVGRDRPTVPASARSAPHVSCRSRSSLRPGSQPPSPAIGRWFPGRPLDGVRAALRHDPGALRRGGAARLDGRRGRRARRRRRRGVSSSGARSDLVILSGDPTAVLRGRLGPAAPTGSASRPRWPPGSVVHGIAGGCRMTPSVLAAIVFDFDPYLHSASGPSAGRRWRSPPPSSWASWSRPSSPAGRPGGRSGSARRSRRRRNARARGTFAATTSCSSSWAPCPAR